MPDIYIIDQIKRHNENVGNERPFLELPIPQPDIQTTERSQPEPKRVIIIDTVDIDPEDDNVIDL